MRNKNFPRFFVLLALIVLAQMAVPFDFLQAGPASDFPPLTESKAYEQYRLRPVSDFSKLLYLVDRFSTLDLQIIYDGHYFNSIFAGRIARWFLQRNYKNETPQDWILRWCNTSVPAGNIIYVKVPSGKFRLARDILRDELKALDDAMANEKKQASQTGVALAGVEHVIAAGPGDDILNPSALLQKPKTKPEALPS